MIPRALWHSPPDFLPRYRSRKRVMCPSTQRTPHRRWYQCMVCKTLISYVTLTRKRGRSLSAPLYPSPRRQYSSTTRRTESCHRPSHSRRLQRRPKSPPDRSQREYPRDIVCSPASLVAPFSAHVLVEILSPSKRTGHLERPRLLHTASESVAPMNSAEQFLWDESSLEPSFKRCALELDDCYVRVSAS